WKPTSPPGANGGCGARRESMMANEFSVDIQGMAEVFSQMDHLSDKLRKRAMQKAITRGAAEMRKAARKEAKRIDNPASARAIYRNVTSRKMPQRKRKRWYPGAVVAVSVGVRSDPAAPGGHTWYWPFIELGTRKQRAQSFMRPAAAQTYDDATRAIAEKLMQEINKPG